MCKMQKKLVSRDGKFLAVVTMRLLNFIAFSDICQIFIQIGSLLPFFDRICRYTFYLTPKFGTCKCVVVQCHFIAEFLYIYGASTTIKKSLYDSALAPLYLCVGKRHEKSHFFLKQSPRYNG